MCWPKESPCPLVCIIIVCHTQASVTSELTADSDVAFLDHNWSHMYMYTFLLSGNINVFCRVRPLHVAGVSALDDSTESTDTISSVCR